LDRAIGNADAFTGELVMTVAGVLGDAVVGVVADVDAGVLADVDAAILASILSRIMSLYKLCAANTRGSIPAVGAVKSMKSSLRFFTATLSFSIIIFSSCF
jgi:hypothetical protein